MFHCWNCFALSYLLLFVFQLAVCCKAIIIILLLIIMIIYIIDYATIAYSNTIIFHSPEEHRMNPEIIANNLHSFYNIIQLRLQKLKQNQRIF